MTKLTSPNRKSKIENRKSQITHREMLAVISDWSRCLRESHQPAPRHLWPPHIHRELAVLRALMLIVKLNRLQTSLNRPPDRVLLAPASNRNS